MKQPDSLIRVPVETLASTEDEEVDARPNFPALLESMRASGGNAVPIFVSPPGQGGRREIYEGHSRVHAARLLHLKEVLAIELPAPLTEVERIEFAAAHNGVRRTMTAEEWAAKAERLIELTGCTQEEAARRLRISPGYLSRVLIALLLPERHREKAKILPASTRAMIASQKSAELQDAAMAYATAPGEDGRLPSRSRVELFLRRHRKGKARGRKPRLLKGRFEGRPFQLEVSDRDNAQSYAEWLRALAKRLERGGADMPPEGWGFLFR